MRRLSKEQRPIISRLGEIGVAVDFDNETGPYVWGRDESNSSGINDEALSILGGLPGVQEIKLITAGKVTGAFLQSLQDWTELRRVYFIGVPISDDALAHLNLHRLTHLTLTGTRVSDVGMRQLSQIESLVELCFFNQLVTDIGCAELAKLRLLETLTLDLPKTTSLSLATLSKLKNLKKLSMGSGRFSKKALAKLRMALPNCEVSTYLD